MTLRTTERLLARAMAGAVVAGLLAGLALLPVAATAAGDDAYRPPAGAPGSALPATQPAGDDAFVPPASQGAYGSPYGGGANGAAAPPSDPGYGQPYTAAPAPGGDDAVSPAPVTAEDYERQTGQSAGGGGFSQTEIIGTGHRFFGNVSQSLGKAIEYAFQSQGQPNGYILGEDAGGALILGLRYGEGTLYTRDAGNHKVFWQGPSLGYDAGAEGSKTMVLVYNMSDPAEIYNRFGGVQGAAYLVGGVSLQFQKYNDVTLGIIRSGVGLRLGANVGYSKYTRAPTWNPL